MALPDDLRAAPDEKLPPRWSRNNPVALAGAEPRDTIPAVIELIVGHPGVYAVIYLGLGVPSPPPVLPRRRPLYPDHRPSGHLHNHDHKHPTFCPPRSPPHTTHTHP